MPRHAPEDARAFVPAPAIDDDTPLFTEPTAAIPRNTPRDVPHVGILQWASGHTKARFTSGGAFGALVGFHAEIGRDADLDAACEAAQTPVIEIRHPRTAGPAEIKLHWSFGESLMFYPVTAGPPAVTIMGCLRNAQATGAAGIGLTWPTGEKSRMAVRGYIPVGSTFVLVQLATRSTMTNALLAALLTHVAHCEQADALIDRARHPDLVACHELAMTLTAGEEVTAGREATTQITPFMQPTLTLTRETIGGLWRPGALNRDAVHAWEGIQVWAAGYASGETNGDSHLTED